MKAVRIHQFGKPDVLQVEEIPSPKARSNRILVEVHAAALNPKDILVRQGKFKLFTGSRFPMTLSSDYAGVVLDPGSSTQLKKGDKVYGMMNGFRVGSTAEQILVKEKEMAYMPSNISFEEAAGIPLAGLTALQALRDLGKLETGQRVCINGASGGVGSLAIQIAKCLGAEVITVSSERNLALCKSLGADQVVDYQQQDWIHQLEEIDVFFDVFGNYSLSRVIPVMGKKARYISTLPRASTLGNHIFTRFSNKKGMLVVVNSHSADLAWMAERIEKGNIKPVIDSVFPLEEIQKAHERVETKRSRGKVIVRVR